MSACGLAVLDDSGLPRCARSKRLTVPLRGSPCPRGPSRNKGNLAVLLPLSLLPVGYSCGPEPYYKVMLLLYWTLLMLSPLRCRES